MGYVVNFWNLNNIYIILCIIRVRHDEVMKPALIQIQVWGQNSIPFPTLITISPNLAHQGWTRPGLKILPDCHP